MKQETVAKVLRSNVRTAYAAFVWVLVFLAWHVVWYVTGLGFPEPSDRDGAERVAWYATQVFIIGMAAVGTVLPLSFATAWGRRLPRRLLLTLGWVAFAVLAGRTLAGTVDTVLRRTGVQPNGLTGLAIDEVMGTASPTAWDWIASYTTDALFLFGAIAFGFATFRYQRATSILGCHSPRVKVMVHSHVWERPGKTPSDTPELVAHTRQESRDPEPFKSNNHRE